MGSLKRGTLFILLLLFNAALNGQNRVDFEDIVLPQTGVWDGSDQSGFFRSGGMKFHNDYNAEWGTWSGFACSNHQDTITQGYTNQYSSAAGGGWGGSGNFAVAYDFGNIRITPDLPAEFTGMYITNSFYAWSSMAKGDGWAKKFGGASGNDPDYFRVLITGVGSEGDTTGTVIFYLADFRDDDPEKDYILKEWKWVDLSSLGTVASLRFSLESSDTGDFGMNTPGYFCIDQINDQATHLLAFQNKRSVSVYPNPFISDIYIDITNFSRAEREEMTISLTGVGGQQLPVQTRREGGIIRVITPAALPAGVYILNISSTLINRSVKIFKQPGI